VEGPYRDLGSGFARLTGPEGARRNPSRLRYVEDALLELLRNARDAGATSIYVASTLKSRRYRTLTIIDDGGGIPETHKDLIFEPGVTSRHLHPVPDPSGAPHGAGLSLYHIKNAAIEARLTSASAPTALRFTFDTHTLPERTLQSGSRPSRSNLQATLVSFAHNSRPSLYHGPPARILATLLKNRIIHPCETTAELRRRALGLGLELSLRTVQRVWRGEVRSVGAVAPARARDDTGRKKRGDRRKIEDGPIEDGPVLVVGEEERGAVADILRRAARASFLEVGELQLESRPGEISVRVRVYEPEENYE
jgi:Histidine kinase-, DNA gyrase B-, and HSP90-like ATPase